MVRFVCTLLLGRHNSNNNNLRVCHLLEEVQDGLQLLPLRLVGPLLPQVDLGRDEGVVHDVEDVRVVRLEEGDHLRRRKMGYEGGWKKDAGSSQ